MKPSNTASIWANPDQIYLELPACSPFTKAHQVSFPATPEGIKALLCTLQARTSDSKIATRGDPTQHNVARLIKEFKGPVQRTRKRYRPELLNSAKEILRKRGMIA